MGERRPAGVVWCWGVVGALVACGVGEVGGGRALAQPVLFVAEQARGAGDGSSWSNASGDLGATLSTARTMNQMSAGAVTEVWVVVGG